MVWNENFWASFFPTRLIYGLGTELDPKLKNDLIIRTIVINGAKKVKQNKALTTFRWLIRCCGRVE